MKKIFILFTISVFSLQVKAQNFAPIPVTGFNSDIVADGAVGAASNSTTAGVDLDANSYRFVSSTFNPGSGICASGVNALPASNTITSTNATTGTGITYTLQGYGSGTSTNNNSLRLANGAVDTLVLTTPTACKTLYLVGLTGSGTSNMEVTVKFTDNTTETLSSVPTMPDWCGGASTYRLTSQVYYRIGFSTTTCTGANCQYLYEIPVNISAANQAKQIAKIAVKNNTASTNQVLLHIMAIGADTYCAVAAPTVTSPINYCLGQTATQLTATGTNLKWYTVANGGTASTTAPTPSTSTAGTQNYWVSQTSGCQSARAQIVVNVSTSVTPTISIAHNAFTPTCPNTSVTYTATPTAGGTSPVYQWKVNGINSGTNSATFVYTPINNDVITCVLTSNAPCATTTTATSNALTMTVNANQQATINITSNAPTPLCSSTSVTFSSTVTLQGSSPGYQWKRNGTNTVTTANYTFTPTNGDVITCVLTSSNTCVTNSPVTSNAITASVITKLTPAVSVAVTPSNNICAGNAVTFTATPYNEGPSPGYQWKVNGVNAGTNSNVFTSSSLNNNDVVTCVLTSSLPCLTAATGTSTGVTMIVNPIMTPVVTAASSHTGIICSGTLVNFTATPVTAPGTTPVYQWYINGNPVGTNSITFNSTTLQNNDVVQVVMISNRPCLTKDRDTSNAITISVSSVTNPDISIASPSGSSICQGAVVQFNALVQDPGSSPLYQWYINNILTGANNTTFYTSTLNTGDMVYCVLKNNDLCASKNIDTSNLLTVQINNHPTPVIVKTGNVLSTTQAFSSYQWIYNNQYISGATQPTYTVTKPGNYWVRVNDNNNCEGESALIYVPYILDIKSALLKDQVKIYPVPASDKVFVQTATSWLGLKWMITAIDGKLMQQGKITSHEFILDVKSLANGLYVLKFENGYTEKIVKE